MDSDRSGEPSDEVPTSAGEPGADGPPSPSPAAPALWPEFAPTTATPGVDGPPDAMLGADGPPPSAYDRVDGAPPPPGYAASPPPPPGYAASPGSTPWPEYATAPDTAAPSRRSRTLMAVAAVAIVAIGGLAAALAINASRSSDAAVPSAGEIVIPQTLGGMAESTNPAVKVLTAGVQAQADSSAQKANTKVKVMGYGDLTKFALLIVVQGPPGAPTPTADEVIRGIVGQAEGQQIAAGATTSFSSPVPVGDGTCVTQSAATATVTKAVGTTCARVVGVEAILVMSVPADAQATVGMVDAAVSAQ